MTYNLTILWNTYMFHLAKQFLYSVNQLSQVLKKKNTNLGQQNRLRNTVLSGLVGDGNSSTAKLQVFKETFNISKSKILPFNKERVLNCLQKLIFNVCFET